MTGITINSDAYIQTDGTLIVSGTQDDTASAADTLVLTTTEGLLTLGLNTQSTTGYGYPVGWSARLTPVGSAWSYGSAVAVAVLLNASSVQIGYASQTLTVQDQPT